MPNGELLSGLPLPDIRGTMGTFYYFATDLSRYEEGNTEFGGILKRLLMEQRRRADRARRPAQPDRPRADPGASGARADAERSGPGDGRRAPGAGRRPRADDRPLEPGGEDRDGRNPGSVAAARARQDEPWIDLEFRVNFLVRLHGMAQLLLMKADNELQLYVSPVNWKPDAPPLPISSPPSFAGDLFQRLGYYRTLGWAEATWPLNEGRMDEQTFMEDLYKAFDDRAQVILSRIDARNWDLLVGVVESTDRVQHMMWRLMDPKHPMYDAALAEKFGDSICASTAAPISSSARRSSASSPARPVLVVSDHGFHSWRKSVNLNTWLVQQGYMVCSRKAARRRARRSSTISLAAASSGRTSTGRGRAPTRWGSARSTSTCAAAKPAASSARAPKPSSSPTS